LNCNTGISIQYANNNIFKGNLLIDNTNGLLINNDCIDNEIFHNSFINNIQNAYDESTNQWFNSSLNEGNYWDDFDESSEGAYDNNSDGIVDMSYDIPGGSNQDIYPLIYPFIILNMNSGWNLITLQRETDMIMASDLAENITGCLSVNAWDAINQTYRPYIVGIPALDFPIYPGMGLFIDSNDNSILTMSGILPTGISIDLHVGWDLIGWYHETGTMASSLAENISGCLSVNAWDALNQTYRPYIVGIPALDFVVTPGMGLFVDVSEESIWTGEG
jgi:hypothetical protein